MSHSAPSAHASHAQSHGGGVHAAAHHHHVTSPAMLTATFLALVALTVLTSALAQVNLGSLDIWITLGIATVKAAMVVMIFMHLQHDNLFNALILLGALLFMTLFLCFVLMDTGQYQQQIDDYLLKQAAMAPPA